MENKISDRKLNFLIIFFVSSFIVYFSYLKLSGYFEKVRQYDILREDFRAKIIRIDTLHDQHGEIKAKLKDSAEVGCYYFSDQNFHVLIGDSLVKKQNSTYIDVYRNGLKKIRVNMIKE